MSDPMFLTLNEVTSALTPSSMFLGAGIQIPIVAISVDQLPLWDELRTQVNHRAGSKIDSFLSATPAGGGVDDGSQRDVF